MPSLITTGSSRSQMASSTSDKVKAARTLSRVHSINRSWGDKEEEEFGGWSPSPEPVRRKLPDSAPIDLRSPSPTKGQLKVAYTGNVKDENGISAADRRRQAMLAAMNQNVDSGPSSSAATTMVAASSYTRPTPATLPVIPSSLLRTDSPALTLPPPQVLPDLPGALEDAAAGLLPKKKRALPWESDIKSDKKKSSRTDSNGSKGSSSSTGSSSNIKQKLCLSAEQQKVLQLVVTEGKNIFFTGSAGTGKSVLLREIIKSLQKKYVKAGDAVAITASTGIAACNIGGITLHSFGGAGLCLEEPAVLVKKIRMNKKAAARWARTQVLIIDEISMVDAELFDKFNKVGQIIRKKPGKPFGGIQIVVTGDFFQLPPVTKSGNPRFCFEAETWGSAIHMSVNLTKVFRQKDQRFVDMLNEMRFGRLSANSIAEFKKLSRDIIYNDGIEPTQLYPRRENVDESNKQRIDRLNTDGYSYNATDGGAVTDPVQREKLLSNFMAPANIVLKVGAQVMLIKNLDTELVNGSMGIVIGFSHRQLFETDKYGKWSPDGDMEGYEGEELEKRLQLRQALNLKAHDGGGSKEFPVVRFKVTTPNSGPGFVKEMLMEPDTFKTELPNGEVQASRLQIPLILSWAMSIHKSQGQTLDRVKVDLGKVFEKGQAYVALSRATTLEGLQVLNFSADKVMAHPKVIKWSSTLKDLNTA